MVLNNMFNKIISTTSSPTQGDTLAAWDNHKRDIAALLEKCGVAPEALQAYMQMIRDQLMVEHMFKDHVPPASKVVAVYGGTHMKAGDAQYEQLVQIGRLFARAGYPVMTGSGPGAMEAAHAGALQEECLILGLGINLPFEESAHPHIHGKDTLVWLDHFNIRQGELIRRADVAVFGEGGFGCLYELFEAWKQELIGKILIRPLILIDPEVSSYWDDFIDVCKRNLKPYIAEEDMDLVFHTHNPEEALEHALLFYRNFISMIYDNHTEVVTLLFKHHIKFDVLEEVQNRYGEDLLTVGKRFSLQREPGTNEERWLISARIDRRHIAKLYKMIDFINRHTLINGKSYELGSMLKGLSV